MPKIILDIVSECVCNILGTNQTIGVCDHETGQCPCLPNVRGEECNSCEINHWKIASGEGCEPCACDSIGAYSEQCNEVRCSFLYEIHSNVFPCNAKSEWIRILWLKWPEHLLGFLLKWPYFYYNTVNAYFVKIFLSLLTVWWSVSVPARVWRPPV